MGLAHDGRLRGGEDGVETPVGGRFGGVEGGAEERGFGVGHRPIVVEAGRAPDRASTQGPRPHDLAGRGFDAKRVLRQRSSSRPGRAPGGVARRRALSTVERTREERKPPGLSTPISARMPVACVTIDRENSEAIETASA
jgi:hypothetical protein